MVSKYIQRAVGDDELGDLAARAADEEEAFFRRNPHLLPIYRNRLLGVALCQGAALQYLGRGYGVKDFDVHFFYRRHPTKHRLSRTVLRTITTIGSFPDVPVDFVRTVVPIAPGPEDEPIAELLREFLVTRPTSNARYLAEKAVIGLWPPALFKVQIWPPA